MACIFLFECVLKKFSKKCFPVLCNCKPVLIFEIWKKKSIPNRSTFSFQKNCCIIRPHLILKSCHPSSLPRSIYFVVDFYYSIFKIYLLKWNLGTWPSILKFNICLFMGTKHTISITFPQYLVIIARSYNHCLSSKERYLV